MISYYELLGMIKDGTNPKKAKFNDTIYIWDSCNYLSENCIYLTDVIRNSYDDAELFEKNIEIIEEDKDIEEITSGELSDRTFTNYQLRADVDVLKDKLNEVIKEVNYLRKGNNNG